MVNRALLSLLDRNVALSFKYNTDALAVISRYFDYLESSKGTRPVATLILLCKHIFKVPAILMQQTVSMLAADFRFTC